MTLKEELSLMKEAKKKMSARIAQIAEAATIEAVREAQRLTPPTMDDLSGTNTRTGNMKASWASDSVTKPVKRGKSYITHLKNNVQYASYVNDGHRMDRHFVPGLYVNPYSGLLEYDPNYNGGLTVGTQTQYVEGIFMVDSAEKVFDQVVDAEMEKLMEEIL